MKTPDPAAETVAPPAPDWAALRAAAAGESSGELAAAVNSDQLRRWRTGARVLAEEYLAAFPDLAADPEAELRVVYGEYLLREELGENAPPEEFVTRFPHLAGRLRQQIDLHRELRADPGRLTTANLSAGPSTTPAGELPTAAPQVPGYEVEREIGRGGMGVVYLARHHRLNRLVALKVVVAGPLAGSAHLLRLATEAEAVAALQHPNIVQVFDTGRHEGVPFLALEYVAGGSLARHLAQHPQSPARAADLVRTLARAVAHAHERGVVHRDLKPANVLLTPDGVPKVADFGLAKRVDGGAGLTQPGVVIGTPSYMPPEQTRGELDVGPPADIYALGAVLYECLTGRPPFLGATPMETVGQVLTRDPVPVRHLRPEVPRDLETICLKCLEKAPRSRYLTAGALADDLQAFLEGRPIVARPVGALGRAWRWRKRNPGLAAAVAVAGLALVLGSTASTGFGLWALESASSARAAAGRAEGEAVRANGEAENARTSAEAERAAARKAQHLLGLMMINEGLKLADDGQLALGLLKIAEATVAAPESPEVVTMARMQFALYRRHCWPGYPLAGLFTHGGPVTSVALSPDGNRVLTGSYDKTARVWDTRTGVPLTPPLEHAGGVTSVAFSPDGRSALTGCTDGTARVWDAATGKPLTGPLKHANGVTRVALSPDGGRVLTGSIDGTARMWDAATGKPIGQVLQHTRAVSSGPFSSNAVYSVSFSPNGKWVLTGSRDCTARLWDATTGKQLWTTPGPTGLIDWVEAAAFSPDSRRLIAGAGKRARVWDVETGKPVSPPLPHAGRVASVAFSPDGRWVLTASADGTARVWDAETGAPISPPLQHTGAVTSVGFGPDGRWVLTASADGTARAWDAASGTPLSPPLRHAGAVSSAVISRDGRVILTGSSDHTARLWSVDPRTPASRTLGHAEPVQTAVFSPDGRRILTGCFDNSAYLWDAETGRSVTPPLPHAEQVTTVAFGPDGRKVLTGSADKTARVWDAETGKPLGPPLSHTGPVVWVGFSSDGLRVLTRDGSARVWDAETGKPLGSPIPTSRREFGGVAFSPDGRRALIENVDQTVGVWDTVTGKPLSPPIKHGVRVDAMVFSPDGKRVLTGSMDGTARVWDAETGTPLSPPLQHAGPLRAVVFSRNGRRILTACDDNTARVWDAETGKPISPRIPQPTWITSTAFSPDGRCVLTAGRDILRVWDAETGKPLSPPLRHANGITSAAFSPDGRRAVTGCSDKTARVWELSPDTRPAADLVRLAQLWSSRRIDDTGTIVELPAEDLLRLWTDLRSRYPAEFTPPLSSEQQSFRFSSHSPVAGITGRARTGSRPEIVGERPRAGGLNR